MPRGQRVNRAQINALTTEDNRRRTHISVRTRKGIELIPVEDIRYFQADQKYVTVRCPDQELIIDETLRELEDEFGDLFLRVHRNAIIAVRHIAGLDRTADNQYSVRLAGVDAGIDVSRRHLAAVRRFIKSI